MPERNLAREPLFRTPGSLHTRSLARHNVEDLLGNATKKTRSEAQIHYGGRAGAVDFTANETGLLVPHSTPAIEEQAQYIAAITGRPDFRVYQPETLGNTDGTQVIPYINLPETAEYIQRLGAETWGLDPHLVAALKNKVNFHHIIEHANITGLEVPDYRIVTQENFVREGANFINWIRNLYEEHDMAERYPVGVMIRMEESDGNYGSVMIYEDNTTNRLVCIPDGTTEEEAKRYFNFSDNAWSQALTYANNYLYGNADPTQHPRAIIGRLLDLSDTPGISIMFKDGEGFSMGWNGQVQADGAKACIGTSSFTTNDNYIRTQQERYEEFTGKALAELVVQVAKGKGISHESLTGPVNFDLMLPGLLEEELRKKRGQGEGVYLAESNPRFTNYTDAIMMAIGILHLEPTVENMWYIINTLGIYNLDKHHHPDPGYTFDPREVRDRLWNLDQQIQGGGTRVFMRMTDNPAGLIIIGDKDHGLARVNHELRQAGRRR